MNQFFDFNRFSSLVFKHWADNKRRYTLSVIAFIGLLITWFVFTMLVDSDSAMGKDMQMITFFFSLFIAGIFYASQYFRDLGSRAKGINFLLVPASAFEKILCSILYTVVLFIIVFIAAFYAADVIMVTIAKGIFEKDPANTDSGLFNIFKVVNLPSEGGLRLNFFLLFFIIQSVFLLGSVYFEKYSFIKTVISGFIVFFSVFCLVYFLYDMMPRGQYMDVPFTAYRIDVAGNDDHLVEIPAWIGKIFYYLVFYGIAPFLWIVTYYRLKEKQV